MIKWQAFFYLSRYVVDFKKEKGKIFSIDPANLSGQ